MTPSQLKPDGQPRTEPFRYTRGDAAQALHAFHHPDHESLSQRAFARQQGLPRTTLQHWLQREQHPGSDPDLAAFCESPPGQHFLRRLVLALQLVFHLDGTAGVRRLGRFLEVTGLDAFVAPSYGAQQALAVTLQESLVQYGLTERSRLAATMPARTLSACLDENFHQEQLCLVAIEPESGFVLLEEYHERRDGQTWTTAVQQAVQGLPVTVVQVTSDQAKGLIACAEEGLEAHHTPDLFHLQRELSKATALPLERQRAVAATAQEHFQSYLQAPEPAMYHSFFDRSNLKLQSVNVLSQTVALLTIQSHDDGGGMARCTKPPCTGALAARGRTLDPFEKHFESYGYGWGSVYRYGGGVGLNLAVAYMFHATNHHKLERWTQLVAIGHAQASTGYALTGSSQGKNGW